VKTFRFHADTSLAEVWQIKAERNSPSGPSWVVPFSEIRDRLRSGGKKDTDLFEIYLGPAPKIK